MLVNLPVCVAQCILSQWLAAEAVSKLDVAFCNRANRSKYLAVLSGSETTDLEMNGAKKSFFCKVHWILLRGVKCSGFRLNSFAKVSPEELDLLDDFFHFAARSVKRVHINARMEVQSVVLVAIADCKCSLTHLTVYGMLLPESSVAMHTILRNSSTVLLEASVETLLTEKSVTAHDINLPGLRKLTLDRSCDIDLCTTCKAAPNLIEICLYKPSYSVTGFAAMAQHCKKLSIVTLWGAADVANMDEIVATIAVGCCQLQRLKLDWCSYLTDTGLTAVATHCAHLTHLTIINNPHITDFPLMLLAHTAGATLESLTLNDCGLISGAGLVAIATRCTALHTLNTSNLPALLRDHVFAMIPHLRNVRHLNLSFCNIDDAVLQLISEHTPHLEYLDIKLHDYQTTYTTAGLVHVARACEKLKVLDVGEYDDWTEQRPGLKVLHSQCS